MDPQQRLFLETSWAAVEDAGYRVSELARIGAGVFVGSGANEYQELLRDAEPDTAPSLLEFCPNLLANRVSHCFNWTGPSELVDMACCSSLAAIHRPCRRCGRANAPWHWLAASISP
jgi:acyl transferase domain-containing protein